MIIRANNPLLRVLLRLPLWVERARVGQDYDSFVRVTLRRP